MLDDRGDLGIAVGDLPADARSHREPRGKVAAGIAFGFNGYRFVQSGHLDILATQWFPLTLWALRRGLRWNHGGYLALAAAFGVLMGLFSVYFVYFLAITVALYGLWWLLVGRRRLPARPRPMRPHWTQRRYPRRVAPGRWR